MQPAPADLAEHRDVSRIAAERSHIVLYPSQCGGLVENATVAPV